MRGRRVAGGLAATMVLTLAPAAVAAPADSDLLRLWLTQPLLPGGGTNVVVTYARFAWLTPQIGVNAFYSTSASGGVRLMTRIPLPAELNLELRGGYRATGLAIGNPDNYRHGPEALVLLSRPFGEGFAGALRLSYAPLWPTSAQAGAPGPSGLALYGAHLTYSPTPASSVLAGVLGQVVHDAAGTVKAHNLGPVLGLVHRF